MSWRSALRRTRAGRGSGVTTRRPPPCVGCREPIDRLDPVAPIDASPSTFESIIGPVPGLWPVVIDDQLVVLDRSTGRRVLLNPTAAVRIAGDLETNLADLLGPVPRYPAAHPAHRIDVVPVETEDSGSGPGARIVVDGRTAARSCPPGEVRALVLDHLDRLGVQRGRGLRFHAGAVERDGNVVIVLGQSGDGKSTLTAALVRHGFGYLTDELAPVDPTTLEVLPYPRPLDLDAASCRAIGVKVPDGAAYENRVKAKISSAELGSVSVGGQAALIVVLAGPSSTQQDPPTTVSELPPAEALMALLPVTFADSFDDLKALEDLAHLCEVTSTVRMTRGPLADMVATVDAELDRATTTTT